jgi:hypothetical protein
MTGRYWSTVTGLAVLLGALAGFVFAKPRLANRVAVRDAVPKADWAALTKEQASAAADTNPVALVAFTSVSCDSCRRALRSTLAFAASHRIGLVVRFMPRESDPIDEAFARSAICLQRRLNMREFLAALQAAIDSPEEDARAKVRRAGRWSSVNDADECERSPETTARLNATRALAEGLGIVAAPAIATDAVVFHGALDERQIEVALRIGQRRTKTA